MKQTVLIGVILFGVICGGHIKEVVAYPSVVRNGESNSLQGFIDTHGGSPIKHLKYQLIDELEDAADQNEFQEYDDTIVAGVTGNIESTDAILSRMLKDYQLRQMYQLLTEDSVEGQRSTAMRGAPLGKNKRSADKRKENLNQVRPGDSLQGIYNDKKDTESWMHQADPSLTVHDLPVDPQIAFRKSTLKKSEGMEEHDEKDGDLLSPLRRGMKEEVMERPALDNSPSRFLPSPFSKGTSQG